MKRVRVITSARLHLGFLDLNGNLGRRFGSIGLSIDAFETTVELRQSPKFEVFGFERERSERLWIRIAESRGLETTGAMTVLSAIPVHAGLGSGTQLALAIASALRRFSGLAPDPSRDAHLLGRGARSGVGAALFERGGLVVDAGRGPSTDLPPIVSRLAFPPDWRILLIMDPSVVGAHSEGERLAFAGLPRLSAEFASEICRRTLMQILPGAAERNLAAFGDGVAAIQEILGDHFSPVQGGGRFTSRAVSRVAERLKEWGAQGVGQSSWGPTGFAFAPDPDRAEYFARRARAENERAIGIKICSARNRGAEIIEESESPNP